MVSKKRLKVYPRIVKVWIITIETAFYNITMLCSNIPFFLQWIHLLRQI